MQDLGLFIPIKIYCYKGINTPYEVSFDKKENNLIVKTISYMKSPLEGIEPELLSETQIELPMEHVKAIIGAYAMCVKQMIEDPKDTSIPILKL